MCAAPLPVRPEFRATAFWAILLNGHAIKMIILFAGAQKTTGGIRARRRHRKGTATARHRQSLVQGTGQIILASAVADDDAGTFSYDAFVILFLYIRFFIVMYFSPRLDNASSAFVPHQRSRASPPFPLVHRSGRAFKSPTRRPRSGFGAAGPGQDQGRAPLASHELHT